MRKKFKKRLLGIILTILMVVSVIPVQQVQPVKAASNESNNSGQTFYLDASKQLSGGDYWDTGTTITVDIYKDGTNSVYKSQTMTKVSDTTNDHLWSITLPCNTWKMYVYRTNWGKNDNFTWELHRDDETNNLVKVTGWKDSYEWGTYTPQQETKPGTYYAKADLVDYFNDSRIDNNETSGYSSNNQGDFLGDKNEKNGVAFSYFNSIISNQFGKNEGTIPLYVGSLLFTNNRVGRSAIGSGTYESLSRWNSTANVALANKGQNSGENLNLTASVQGLVQDTLGTGDALMGLDGKELPFFSKKFAESEKAQIGGRPVMQYFSDYQFPFTESTENSVTTYSYDSASDKAVYIDWGDSDNKKLIQSDSHIYNNDESKGYYPFNKEVDANNKANRNFGFGTKFTIPFTINENGTIDGKENGKPITFDFTGDDDVWVFLDGKLILDMGGAHAKATGSIDFKNLTATVNNAAKATTGTKQMIDKPSNEITSYQNQSLENYVWNNATERSTVSSSDATLDFKKTYGKDYADTFKDPSKVHTLTMFYMERGMHDSNMKIQFTINPLPSGLSVSKQVDTKNVNKGLQTAVADKDTFNFEMKKGTSEENLENVSGVNYSFYDGKTTHDEKVGTDGKIKLKDKQYASSFENDDETDAFKPGDYFNITETADENYETRWYVTDLDKSEEEQKKPEYSDNNTVAKFNLGQNTGQFSKANYNVNFVNTPKVGTVNITKAWKGDIPDTLKNTEFPFKVEVDLDGEADEYGYSKYPLEYTVDGIKYKTNASGEFTLQSGKIAAFEGIPIGAKVKVTETKTTDDKSWIVSGPNVAESTPVTEGSNQTLTITNATKTITSDKVIYVEAKKDTLYQPADVKTGYTVSEMSDGLTYTTDKGFYGKEPGQSYTANYTGSNKDGAIVNGKITVYTYKATDKVYVFDYGLESDIAKPNDNNDGLFQDGTFYNDNAEKDGYVTTAELNQITHENDSNPQTTITPDKNVIINEDGSAKGAVTFKPVAFMDKAENYTYTADITKNGATLDSENPETGTTVHGTIKTMPANVVYYEDNFNEKANSSNSAVKIIYSENNTSKDGTDVKLEQSNDQSEQYGHDNAYANGDKYSSGSSTKMEKSATATFTFKGTGFDIISRTNTETGTIGVKVYKGENASGTPIKNIPLITYYDDGDLYQVPVIHETGLGYGTYTVVVEVKSYNPEGIVFYLDGVRIYGPLCDTDDEGNLTDDTENYLDSEVDAHIYEIRPMIIGNTVDGDTDNHAMLMQYRPGGELVLSAGGNTVVETLKGAVPEEATKTTDDFEKYWKWGPNNELYLEPGNAVGFLIPADDDIYDPTDQYTTFQIGAKTTSKDAVTLKTILPNGSVAKDSTITVNSATDMYYKINVTDEMKTEDGKYYKVIIANTDGGMVSLTNIKSTCNPIGFGVPAEDTTAMRMMAASMISAFSTKDEVVSEAAFATVVRSGRNATLAVTSTVGVEKLKITDSNGQVMDSSTLNISYTDKVLNGNKLRTWRVKFKPNLKRGKYKYTVEGITAENKATVRIGTPTLTVR